MPGVNQCVPCCTSPQVVNTPGAQGSDGTNGTNGINAFTTVDTPGFTVPAVGSTVTAALVNSQWMTIGQNIIVQGPANFVVTALPSPTSATIEFLGYPGDVNVGTSIAQGATVSAAGQRGGSTLAVTTTAVSYAPTAFDDVILVTVDNKTITLPTAVGIKGKVYTIKQTAVFGSGTVIATTGGQTIDGAATKTISAQYKDFSVISDGSNWAILFAF